MTGDTHYHAKLSDFARYLEIPMVDEGGSNYFRIHDDNVKKKDDIWICEEER